MTIRWPHCENRPSGTERCTAHCVETTRNSAATAEGAELRLTGNRIDAHGRESAGGRWPNCAGRRSSQCWLALADFQQN